MPTPQPCTDCGTPTHHTRCTTCAHKRSTKRLHHHPYNDPTYRANRTQLLATATHCHICGKPPTPTDPLTADHIEPIATAKAEGRPPNHHLTNLRPAHRSCNSARGSSDPP